MILGNPHSIQFKEDQFTILLALIQGASEGMDGFQATVTPRWGRGDRWVGGGMQFQLVTWSGQLHNVHLS
jgi:hypothetical protein